MSIINAIFSGLSELRDGFSEMFKSSGQQLADCFADIDACNEAYDRHKKAVNDGLCVVENNYSGGMDAIGELIKKFMRYAYRRMKGYGTQDFYFSRDDVEFLAGLRKPLIRYLFCTYGYLKNDEVNKSYVNSLRHCERMGYKINEFNYIMAAFTDGHELYSQNEYATSHIVMDNGGGNTNPYLWKIDDKAYAAVMGAIHELKAGYGM